MNAFTVTDTSSGSCDSVSAVWTTWKQKCEYRQTNVGVRFPSICCVWLDLIDQLTSIFVLTIQYFDPQVRISSSN